ncbi:hypothetical protein BDV35DRAFT_152058 [Aspergillus flavus]|uniref:Uncharacterized protein n=1 Tax=Aspergillus flavus TaxID=5059 RepID=A0A5N6H4B7_ASPFL|nr:hypothetical protein BDV35DRAFT_152058 [Aspergillus flavus]
MHAFCLKWRIHKNCCRRTFKTMRKRRESSGLVVGTGWIYNPRLFEFSQHLAPSGTAYCVSCFMQGHCMRPYVTMGLWSCRSMRLLQSTFSYIRSRVRCTNTMSSLESIVSAAKTTDQRTAKEKAPVQPCQPIRKTCRHSRFCNHSDNSASTGRASCDKRYTRLPGRLVVMVFPNNLKVDPLSSGLRSPQFSCP